MKSGYYALADATSPLVSDVPGTQGSHGFSPEYPEMRAAFFIAGPGIARGRDLGLIDMRQIAPTVAQLLGVRLSQATQAPLILR
jgi:predicted AlkP superfamily pyrophosphatase or phosphodiesterase